MRRIAEEMQSHHKEILSTLSRHVGAIIADGDADPARFVSFLRNQVLPHAIGEEEHLYPALDPLVIAYGRPTAGMRIDYEYIEGYIDWIEETVEQLETADPVERGPLETLLRRLCLQLEAVLQLHLAKEERIYFPLFSRYLPEEEQQRILDRMDQTEHRTLDEDREPFYAHKVATQV